MDLTTTLGFVRKVHKCPKCKTPLVLSKWPFRVYWLGVVVYFAALITLLWILPNKKMWKLTTWTGLFVLFFIGRSVHILSVSEPEIKLNNENPEPRV